MSKSAQSHQAAQARGIRRFVPVSIKPVVVKLTRKLSVTYWPGRRRTISGALLALLAGFVPSLVAASPTGSRVVSGSAVVSRPNASTTLVTQGTQNAIINWQSFSIGVGEGVRFVQPSASAVALNRVVGNDPSRIFGSLSSNGKVFLVNTAGVYFAPGASVDVGGLVASSMNISDRNFMAGNYKFESGANAGAVDNQGMLRGAFVVLAAPQVSNSGSIVATGGAAALAAGGRVSLDIAGDKLVSLNVDAATANAAVTNSGSISADGGKVFMSAHSANAVLDTVINTSGVVRANSIGMRDGQIVIDGGNAGTVAVSGTLAASGAQAGAHGGSVAVLGDRVNLQAGANVDVSGDAGGGSARIGGDFHGAGALKTASQTQVEKGAAINADAITSGNGGTVAVWSDQHTAFAGSISAKGGAQGGDGGFVETSGKKTLAFSGAVTTKAAKGATGTLLLDPTDITITTAPTASASESGGSYTGSASSSNINDGDLTTALGTTNVIVDASAGPGSGTGNITVGTAITWNSANSLTLKAVNNIDTTGGAITSNGGGAVSLYGDGAITTGAITTTGGAVEIAGTGGGTSKAGSFTGGSITSSTGNVTVQANGGVSTGAINSGGGTINVTGDSAVTINGALASAASGDAIIIKAGAQSSAGSAGGGDISISGGSISVGGSGRAILYTGSVAGSTGLSPSVSNGNFRYGSDAGNTNFSAGLGATGVYAVYRESPVLTVTGGSESLTYGAPMPTATASVTGGLQNGDTEGQALAPGLNASFSSSTSGSGLLKAGTYVVSASGAVDQLGYSIAYAPGAITVAQKALSVSGLSVPASKVYDGNTTAVVNGTASLDAPELAGTGSSADFKPYSNDVVSVSGTPTGTYDSKNVLTATQVMLGGIALAGADAGNYILTAPVAPGATITPRALSASVSAPDKMYDGTTTAAPALAVTGGLVGSETVTASGAGTFNSKNVASASLVTVNSVSLADGANGGLASNYSLAAGGTAAAHITPAVLTATLSAPDKVYDGDTIAIPTVVIASGLVGTETVDATGTASFNSKDVVTANQVTLNTTSLADGSNGGLASNYSLAAGATGTAHITPKSLTATVAAPDKVYDGTMIAAPTLTIMGGLVGAETVVASGTANFNTKDVSTANLVTVAGSTLADGTNGGLGSNYSLAAGQTATAHITPAVLTASLSAPDKVYDGDTTATPVVVIASGLVGSETVNASGTASFNSKDVATANQVTLDIASLADGSNGGLASNYSLAAGATATAHITPKSLTATVAAPDKVYDGTTIAAPTLTITGGLVGTETIAATGTANFNSKDVVTANLVTVDGTSLADGANGGLASNYSLAVGQSVIAHVTPKALVASASSADKVYDGTTGAPASMNITGGLVGAETLTAAATGSYDSKDVLTATQVTIDTVTLLNGANGGLASNYSISAPGAPIAAHITPKALSMSGLTATTSKVYDGNVGAAVAGVAALDASEAAGAGNATDGKSYTGDAVAIAGAPTGTYNSKDVASATSIAFGGLSLSGADQANYSLAIQAPVAAVVTPKALSATATAVDKAYDGTTTALPALTITGGLVGTETVTASGIASFNTKDVVTANLVTVDATSLADGANGGLAGNYSLAAGQTATAHITPAVLTATMTAPDKVYDGNTTASPTVIVASGLVGAETVTASGTASFDSKDVLTANLVTLDTTALADGANGGMASNYSLAAGVTTTAHITTKSLTATVAAPDKVYDGTTTAAPALTITGGLVGTETLAASGAGTFDSKDVLMASLVTVDSTTLADGANGGLASNYSLAAGQTVTAHVTPKALVASGSAADKVYDGTVAAPAAMDITGGLVGAETLSASATGSYNSKDVATANQVTIDTVTLLNGANGGLASNYSIAAPGAPIAAHITPKALSMSGLTATSSKVYDGTLSAAVGGVATLDASEAVGTGNATDGKSYTGDAVVIAGVATGTYNSKDVAGASTIAFGGLSLSGADQSNYSLTIQAPVAGVVTQRVLGAAASAPDKVYDGVVTAAPTLAITSGLVGSETLDVTAVGTFNSKDVATANQVTVNSASLADGANGGLANNYSLTAGQTATAHITAKALTAAVAAPDKVYDGSVAAAPTLTITSGLVGAETVDASGTASFNSKNVASANLVTVNSTVLANGANGGLASNYSLAAGQSVVAHVTRKALTATVAAPDKTYDGTTVAAPTLTTAGMIGAETVIANAIGAFNSKNVLDANLVTVGTVALADGANGGLAGNYSLAAGQTAVAHITPKALAATASAPNKVYDANVTAAPTLAITAAGLVGTETVTATATGTFNSKDVATAHHVTVNTATLLNGANGGLASNYSLAAGQTALAQVTPKALTASVTAPDKIYDGLTTAAPTLAITGGLVVGETVNATGTATFNTKDVPTANLVTVNSTALANGANGGLASNYSLASGQTVIAHISRKTLSMSGLSVPASKVYNANTVAVVSGTANLQAAEAAGTGTTSDLKPYVGDSLAISGTPVGTYNSKDVASASTVTYSGMSLTGAQAANYLLTTQGPSAATIAKAHITSVSSISSASKVYDGNTAAGIFAGGAVFTGMVAGDGLSVAGGTATFGDRNVGTNKVVSIGGFTLAGSNAPNYILDNNNALALANITRLPSVTYIGASGGDWASAANWEAGALPDLANVQNVVIPTGKTVNFTSDVARINGTVQIDGVTGAGTLNVGSGAINVAHALNIGGYSQTGGAVGAESMAANASFNQTGGSLSVTKALGIQQAAGTVSLGNLTAATLAIGGGAGVRQVDGGALVVRDGITLATGGGDAILGNANNDFDKVTIGSANNVTLMTKADGLAFGGATVGGDLVATTPGAVTQTGTMSVQGATTLGAGGALHLDDAANSLHGKVKLTTGADASLAATGGVALGGDIAGKLALTTTGAVTQAGDALHVTGTSTVNAGSSDIVLTNTDNDFGAALSASGRNIAVADKTALAFGATTATGTFDATAGGAVTQSGKLAVGGAGSIVAAGQAVTLADNANTFGGTLRLGAASATVNAAATLGVTSEVTGALTLTAPQLTVSAANALNLHVATTGAATVNADKALAIDGNVNGALVAKAGGAVTQGAAALTIGGASDIQAVGQTVVLANAGNDFGGDLKLAAASAQLADKNALSFTSAAVTGNLQASAKGDVTQKGAMSVGGTTSVDTTGAVTLANATNDFVGAVGGSGSTFTLTDANLLTVGKITAPQVDLTAGYGFQMTGSGIVDSPKVSLALTQLASNGSIGTATLPFKVKDSANVTLGALTPAVPAFFGGSGVQVSVTNGVALREYSRELVALYLGNSKPYNRVLDDFVSQNIVSLSKILRDAQKKADSSTDLIDNGMPIDLTERVAYPHAGTLKLKEPCKDSKDKACK